jgi:hypothetical protein
MISQSINRNTTSQNRHLSPSGNPSDASDMITSGGHRTQTDVEKCGHKKMSFVGSGLKTRVVILHIMPTRKHPQPDH